MKKYKDMIQHILDNGVESDDRTGVGTLSVFGYQTRYDLNEGFPIVTTKKTPFKTAIAELLWVLEGSTDERRLAELTYGQDRSELVGKTTIWQENADNQGKSLGFQNTDTVKELGKVYGFLWRKFDNQNFDQLKWVINEIKRNPNSRRLLISGWNPLVMHEQSLPACHTFFQFYVRNHKLDGQLYMRSNDVFLGNPFNVVFYSALIHLVAKECGYEVGELVVSIGDAHIYKNHVEQCQEVLKREPYPLPTIQFDPDIHRQFNECVYNNKPFSLDAASKITLNGYKYHPAIKAQMAV